ncbi:hypothetical protein [Nonomuraea endophytica]|uniref:hypothetical protein n=1 Tax=Nonomuraea endophytica TaxID=714136 RepID=UPI0037CB00C8
MITPTFEKCAGQAVEAADAQASFDLFNLDVSPAGQVPSRSDLGFQPLSGWSPGRSDGDDADADQPELPILPHDDEENLPYRSTDRHILGWSAATAKGT